jgi:protein gp37
MGDIFHDDVRFDWQLQVWLQIEANPRHRFFMLTKRPERMKKFFDFLFRNPVEISGLKQPFNLWLGVSVENQRTADERVPILLQIPAAKSFVSVEPMLGSVDLSRRGMGLQCESCLDRLVHWCGDPVIDWIICGGETGPKARPMNPDWARLLRDQCHAAGVPFFFKQMSSKQSIPKDLMIREFPK